jgi:hypothetical protein
MSMTADMAQRWLDAYTHAWTTYEPGEIGALFTDDAQYRWHPWDEGDDVARGRDQIVAAWLEHRDPAGTYRGVYRPLQVTDDLVIAMGTTSYYTDDTRATLERTYYNLWVLRFSEDGQCRSFTEWYMQAPRSA